MDISENEYARLVRWAEQQRQHIAALEQENRELRRQLEDLRRGVGMAVVVQGRVIPVNPAPAEVPLPNAGPMPHPSFGPAFYTPSQQSQPAPQPPQQPVQQPQPTAHRRAIPHLQPAPRPEAFSEELWITGQMRAVKAPTQAPTPTPAATQRPLTASQDMTPSWLREDVPPAPPAPRPRRTLAAATSSHPAIPKPPAPAAQPPSAPMAPTQQTGRQRVPARPLSRPSAPLPSLAQLTGQQPAVRVPGRQRRNPDERNPYSDSFVLD